MEIAITVQLIILSVCGIFAYSIFRKVKSIRETRQADYRKWISTIKFWWYNSKRTKIYEYLKEKKFDKLKAIENVKNLEDLGKILNEDVPDSYLFYGTDPEGNSLFLKLINKRNEKELLLFLNLSDGRTYELPDHPSTVCYNTKKQNWSISGLKISVCEPLKRWRITYNGLLRNGIRKNITNGMKKIEHVRFNFIFIGNSAPITKLDLCNKDKKENYVSSGKVNGFDQWGSLIGQITFENSSTKEIFLRGLRQREWENEIFSKYERVINVYGTIKGITFYLNIRQIKDCSELVKCGHFKMMDGTIHAVKLINFNTEAFINLKEGNSENIRFEAGDKLFDLSTTYQEDSKRQLHHGDLFNEEYLTYNIKLQQNENEGSALVLIWNPQNNISSTKTASKFPRPLDPNLFKESLKFVVSFEDEICQYEELVGGKARSLALLTSIETNDFSVPRGFCVSAISLQCQIDNCEELSRAIVDIERINMNKKVEDLKNYCEKTVSLLQNTTIIDPLREEILCALTEFERREKLINKKNNTIRYAVRSSAIGEDGEETSAAGQNMTFLGIKDPEDVLKHVTYCWASLYSYQSVEYRRRQGMPIKALMGVCVQIMVNADVAGVMFTKHPTTGDPRNIIITSNYGLGETVVSAMVDPDTIIIERNWDDYLIVKSIQIGKKSQKITMNEDSGTRQSELNEEETRNNSLSYKSALSLALVGIHLENIFQNPQDIEWAIVGDKIYLLQSRPITAVDNWTEFELTHELDSIVPAENDLLMFGNVGEVFPGVTTPLTISTVIVFLNGVINANFKKPSIVPYCDYNIHVSSMRITINYLNTMMVHIEKEVSIQNKIIDLAVCGNIVVTPEIHKQGQERNGTMSGLEFWLQGVNTLLNLVNVNAKSEEVIKICKNMKLDANQYDTMIDLYQAIDSSLDILEKVAEYHEITSNVSVTYEIILMGILTEGNKDLTADHCSDIAVLLSSCNNVISAQIPIALKRISKLIRETEKWEEFSQINCDKVSDWLRENCSEAADLLEKFINKHGHRGIKEMDFITEPWAMKSEELFKAIQSMVRFPMEVKENENLSSEIVDKLITPKKILTKLLLRMLVPFVRKAVARRELTKSVLTKVIHKLRLSYRKLAKLMLIENRIPDERLIFFLTHYEIGLLVEKHDPALARKAFARQRLYSKLERNQCTKFNLEEPTPLQPQNEKPIHQNLVKITGSSVYNGKVHARACVIENVAQAEEIQFGDILITRATDIGWSPYFPVLGGVVTELGGLISHGAVVAREYGLPCVVGAEGATQVFKTGQMVFLNANAGTVEVMEKMT